MAAHPRGVSGLGSASFPDAIAVLSGLSRGPCSPPPLLRRVVAPACVWARSGPSEAPLRHQRGGALVVARLFYVLRRACGPSVAVPRRLRACSLMLCGCASSIALQLSRRLFDVALRAIRCLFGVTMRLIRAWCGGVSQGSLARRRVGSVTRCQRVLPSQRVALHGVHQHCAVAWHSSYTACYDPYPNLIACASLPLACDIFVATTNANIVHDRTHVDGQTNRPSPHRRGYRWRHRYQLLSGLHVALLSQCFM